MKRNINIYDFNFECAGYGHYKVTYTSQRLAKNGLQQLTICH